MENLMNYVTIEADIENGRIVPKDKCDLPERGRALITLLPAEASERDASAAMEDFRDESQRLDEAYVIEQPVLTLRFIGENQLTETLLDAREHLAVAFGKNAIKTLSVRRDDEGFETLFCLVKLRGDAHSAMSALNEFDDRWWSAYPRRSPGRLNFDFELE
jgi:hypothetical protein